MYSNTRIHRRVYTASARHKGMGIRLAQIRMQGCRCIGIHRIWRSSRVPGTTMRRPLSVPLVLRYGRNRAKDLAGKTAGKTARS